MGVTVFLAGLLLTASVTDVRSRRVYNWTTYPGILLALAFNSLVVVLGWDLQASWNGHWGLIGMPDSFVGFVLCGFIMLLCYVFFFGGVGGGDVKLLAMIGAFLGPSRGLEALLWTFALAACTAVGWMVWRVGAWRLLGHGVRRLVYLLRFRTWTVPTDDQRELWKTDVFLSPAALAAVLIVQFPWLVGW